MDIIYLNWRPLSKLVLDCKLDRHLMLGTLACNLAIGNKLVVFVLTVIERSEMLLTHLTVNMIEVE